MPRRNRVLRVGDVAPTFDLPVAGTGRTRKLEDLRGAPLVIIFGRGTW
ncbi:MAG: hypothetical protein ACYC55_08195 [Candidatus Geothermincolia bacterium]